MFLFLMMVTMESTIFWDVSYIIGYRITDASEGSISFILREQSKLDWRRFILKTCGSETSAGTNNHHIEVSYYE
jgi:hypothetical protein